MVFGYDEESSCSNNEENKIYEKVTSSSGPMDLQWPMLGHDSKHTGRSPYSTTDNNYIEKWRFRTDSPIDSSPVIDKNGTIYVAGGSFYAINPNGTLKWKKEDIWFGGSSPVIDKNGIIYVSTPIRTRPYLWAFYPNGTVKWKFKVTSSIKSSPIVDTDGTVYFSTFDEKGKFYAINPDGIEKWHYDADYYCQSSPAISDDNTIYFASHVSLYAFYSNGTLKWKNKLGDKNFVFLGGPSIGNDGSIYIARDGGYLYSINPNGTIQWNTQIAGGSTKTPSIGEDGMIYIASRNFYAIYPNGTIKWSYTPGKEKEFYFKSKTYAISQEQTIYASFTKESMYGGELIALNSDGTVRWQSGKICDDWIFSSPCISNDGTVYIGSHSKLRVEGNRVETLGYLHAFGNVESNKKPGIPVIYGTTNGTKKEYYEYFVSAEDPDNNPVYFYIDSFYTSME